MPALKGQVVLHHTADAVVLDKQLPPNRLTTETLRGVFSSADGVTATWFGVAQIHSFDGRTFLAQVIEVYGFDDGASFAVKAEISFTEDGSNTYAGDTVIMGGTGRFEGIQGRGKLKGWSDGYNAKHDVEIDYVIPGREADPESST